VYFNGLEAYKAGITAIEESHKDNYTQVLPVFEESDQASASVASSNMDRAIEKGTKLIIRHSITAKPKSKPSSQKSKKNRGKKEYNKWVDDALLLIGKAQTIKQDYRQAIRTFDLLIRDFPHSDSKYEALLWKARAYTELGEYNNAKIALESYDLDGNAPDDFYGQYMEVYANLLLKQEKYKEAIPVVQNAIKGIKRKKDKARYYFILGQLKELQGDRDGAAKAYAQSLRNHPDYEMAFNASLRKASILYRDASIDEIMKQIRKMLRDKKNEEFQDQIYYALGRVYLNFDDEKNAINSFIKSVEVSVNNDYQKALSFKSIADIYFKNEMFKPAYQYYDSTLTVMTEESKNYEEVLERRDVLSLLVPQLNIIYAKDSLIRLADMDPAERDKLIELYIDREKRMLEKKKQLEKKSSGDNFYYGGGSSYRSTGPQTGSGQWYFYNPSAKEMGKQEFIRIWGNRKLTDNWRRKNKSVVSTQSELAEPGEPMDPGFPPDNENQQEQTDNKQTQDQTTAQAPEDRVPTKKELLAGLPLDKESYDKAMLERDLSKFEAGMIFLEQLKNYPLAIKMLEDCLDSPVFPVEDREDAYIALYRAYDEINDISNKQRTLNNLRNEFPDSRFIEYLEDPDFLAKIQAEKKKIDDEYAATYEKYLTGEYEYVISKATDVERNDTTNVYMPKYKLIKALSFARQGNADMFEQELTSLTTKFPGTEEANLATAFLDQLKQGKKPVKSTTPYKSLMAQRLKKLEQTDIADSTKKVADMTGFLYTPEEPHTFIALPPENADINRLVFNLADFNFSRYLLNDYAITTSKLPDDSPVIMVKEFKNKIESMDYFYAVREKEDQIFGSDSAKTILFVISKSNLKFFMSSGQINNYNAFFTNLYLKTVDLKDIPEEMLKKPESTKTNPGQTAQAVTDSTTASVPETGAGQQNDNTVATTENTAAEQNKKTGIKTQEAEEAAVVAAAAT
jgi:tetratricopeptide (TPR) repeat protein